MIYGNIKEIEFVHDYLLFFLGLTRSKRVFEVPVLLLVFLVCFNVPALCVCFCVNKPMINNPSIEY